MKSSIALAFTLLSFGAKATTNICYVPGAGGGSTFQVQVLPVELAKRNIPFIMFDVGGKGTVQQRAQNFINILQKELIKDPDLKCHAEGYSMGGLTLRYAMNHLKVKHPTKGEIAVSSLFLTMSTFATPHRGTPLAKFLGDYTNQGDPGLYQMSEANVAAEFNDPGRVDTYSPVNSAIPFFSYRTGLDNVNQTFSMLERMGFQIIFADYQSRGVDPRNDGVVPTISSGLAKVLGDLKVPHGYFARDVGLKPNAVDFHEMHWHFLNGDLNGGIHDFENPERVSPAPSADELFRE